MNHNQPSKDAQDFHEISNNTPPDVLKVLTELGELVDAALTEYGKQADEYWHGLSPDQQLMAFYAVCKRIHTGDVLNKGSYRHVLYDVFGFDTDSYGVGMACGYLAIHNHIAESVADSQPEPTVKPAND